MAINQDANVEELENDDATASNVKTVGDAHLDIYEALAEKARASQEATQAQYEADTGQTQEDLQSADNQVDAAVNVIDDTEKYAVRVKLEGEEQEFTVADIIRGFQKNEVASRRLNEASAKLREAEEVLAKAKQQANPETESSQPSVGEDATTIAKSAIEALLNGDEEAAVNALAQLSAGRGNSTQEDNTDAVAARVKQQLEVDSALTKFESDYADVVSDPHLATITNNYLKEEMESGAHATQYDALVAAGDRARDWLAQLTGKTPDNQSSTIRNDRVAKKAGMEKVPSNSASAASQDEPTETAADIIAEMKKARGLIA